MGVIVRFVRTETIQLFNNYFYSMKFISDNSAHKRGDALKTSKQAKSAPSPFFISTWRGKREGGRGYYIHLINKPPPVFLMFRQSLHIEKLPSPVGREYTDDAQSLRNLNKLFHTLSIVKTFQKSLQLLKLSNSK